MAIRRNDKNGDWTFGQGSANYAREDEEIIQDVSTRIRSWQQDWYLDTFANIDWYNLLGNPLTQDSIVSNIGDVTLSTIGVTKLNGVEIIEIDPGNRNARISINFDTINGNNFETIVGVADNGNN